MQDTQDTLDLGELLAILLRRIGVILLVTVISAGAVFSYFKFIVSPVYTAETLLYVNNNNRSKVDDLTGVNINDINASQKLVNTYIVILQSDDLLKRVMSDCGIDEELEDFKKMVTMKSVNNTEVLSIAVTTKSPEQSAQIANSFTGAASEEIIRVVKAGSVEVVSPAVAPMKPSGPRSTLNGIIGGMLGAVLSSLTVLVLALLDTTIKDEEDVLKHYNIPVLGEVPSITQAEKGGYGYGKYGA